MLSVPQTSVTPALSGNTLPSNSARSPSLCDHSDFSFCVGGQSVNSPETERAACRPEASSNFRCQDTTHYLDQAGIEIDFEYGYQVSHQGASDAELVTPDAELVTPDADLVTPDVDLVTTRVALTIKSSDARLVRQPASAETATASCKNSLWHAVQANIGVSGMESLHKFRRSTRTASLRNTIWRLRMLYCCHPLTRWSLWMSRPISRKIKCAAVFLLTIETAIISIPMTMADGDACNESRLERDQFSDAGWTQVAKDGIIVNGVQVLLIGPILAHMTCRCPVVHLRWLVLYSLVAFAQAWLWHAMWVAWLHGWCRLGSMLGGLATATWFAFYLASPMVVLRTVTVLSQAAVTDGGTKCLIRVLHGLVVAVTGCAYCWRFEDPRSWPSAVFAWIFMALLCLFAVQSVWSIAQMRSTVIAAQKKLDTAKGRRDLQLSRTALRDGLVGAVCCNVFMLLRAIFLARYGGVRPFAEIPVDSVTLRRYYVSIFDATGVVGLMMAAVMVSGYFRGAVDKAQLVQESRRLHARYVAENTYKPDCDDAWQHAVENLALRGITLQALLRFYSGLGKHYMMHYDSSKSTTGDVVRQAIIPVTAESGTSLSEFMMKGSRTKPKTMITHNWSNLFRDLVAAIVADAIRDETYAWAADMLDKDIGELERRLEAANVQRRTYWVCAFAVNQHHAICGCVSDDDMDHVTGERHVPCSCHRPKFLNHTPPFRESDKAGIFCEMNKFDDMMAYLAARSADFKHVIAVDRQFAVFTRAWAVAEVAEGFKSGLQQTLKIESEELLSQHEDSLRQLRIELMQASRPEDVDVILARIPDKEAFNEQMQHLLFHELIANWKKVDLTHRLRVAGRLARDAA